ncbi:acyl-CoA/acyl-ACP dehydrogenase [bacterium]|nr:acyl-CoA/acyl-ACP dehydrogenase [bacterium]
MNDSEFQQFVQTFQDRVRDRLSKQAAYETVNYLEGLPRDLLDPLLELSPLSVFVPKAYGGDGGTPARCLALLEATSYESIAVGLMLGISGSLFLDPVAKYGNETVKAHVFKRFLQEKVLGGLMITEPDFGTDALALQTAYQVSDGLCHIQGEKHWGGLTGLADFWLMTARQQKSNGKLARDVDLFICEMAQPGQRIVVESYYHKLGLFLIPYGLNRVDINVPLTSKLNSTSSGLKMMMDLLHRSRLRLSGIGIGFIRRMLDEAVSHCQTRFVSGSRLDEYDQVQHRLSELQAWYTINSGMCAFTARVSSIDSDLSGLGLQANANKAILTDMMQEAAQSLLQLVGAKGYRRDHIAGRAIVDCRPFQIFEGSNDVMYSQIADVFLKAMKRAMEPNLLRFCTTFEPVSKAADHYRDLLDIRIDTEAVQRLRVRMGKIVAWLISIGYVLDLTGQQFRQDLIDNAVAVVRTRIAEQVSGLKQPNPVSLVADYANGSDWKQVL